MAIAKYIGPTAAVQKATPACPPAQTPAYQQAKRRGSRLISAARRSQRARCSGCYAPTHNTVHGITCPPTKHHVVLPYNPTTPPPSQTSTHMLAKRRGSSRTSAVRRGGSNQGSHQPNNTPPRHQGSHQPNDTPACHSQTHSTYNSRTPSQHHRTHATSHLSGAGKTAARSWHGKLAGRPRLSPPQKHAHAGSPHFSPSKYTHASHNRARMPATPSRSARLQLRVAVVIRHALLMHQRSLQVA